MVYKGFDEIIEKARAEKRKKRLAVAAAGESHVLDAVMQAWEEDIIAPWLVGQPSDIKDILHNEMKIDFPDEYIVEANNEIEAAFESVKLVREGKADFLMKGLIETSTILRAMFHEETGISAGRTVSQLAIHDVPSYHKLLGITDGAIVNQPTLEQKRDMVQNAVDALRNLGYERPNVAALAAIEKVNSKMPETVEAAALKEMWKNGVITDCELEGPISFDLAFDQEAGKIKGYTSPVAGNPDILLMPNLPAANIFGKSLRRFAGSVTAGVVIGAKVPMVLVSRSADIQSKYASIVVTSEMVL